MRAEEAYAAYKIVHEDEIQQESSYRQASLLMDRQEGYLAGQAREGNLSIYDALHSLELVGHPLPQESFNTAFCRLDTDPALILEAAREHQHLAPDLYFREVAPRIEMLVKAGSTPGSHLRSRANKIAEFDELRRSDRLQAKEKLQLLISGLVERMEQTGERPPRAYGELAWALGVCATMQRCAGRRNDAVDLLVVSRALWSLAEDCQVEGDWFVRAGLLLVDLGRTTRAHQFMLEASSKYFLAGSPAKQAEAELGRAHVLSHAGEYRSSIRLLELVLPHIPVEQLELRRFAHELLAENLVQLGELKKARCHLSTAIGLVSNDLARASCHWSHAHLLNKLGHTSKAIAAYNEAMPLVAKVTGAGELAEMAMEYAKLLVQENRWPELQALAADLSGSIQELRGHRKLRDIIDDFTALTEFNQLTEAALEDFQVRILKCKEATRRARTGLPNG